MRREAKLAARTLPATQHFGLFGFSFSSGPTGEVEILGISQRHEAQIAGSRWDHSTDKAVERRSHGPNRRVVLVGIEVIQEVVITTHFWIFFNLPPRTIA